MDINEVCKFAECKASEVFEGTEAEALAELFAKASRGGPLYEVYNTEMDVKLNGTDGWADLHALAMALEGTSFTIHGRGVDWVGQYGAGWLKLSYSNPFDTGPTSVFVDGMYGKPHWAGGLLG